MIPQIRRDKESKWEDLTYNTLTGQFLSMQHGQIKRNYWKNVNKFTRLPLPFKGECISGENNLAKNISKIWPEPDPEMFLLSDCTRYAVHPHFLSMV